MKKIIKLLISICICTLIIPTYVYAEGDTYKEFAGGCISWKMNNTRYQTVDTQWGFSAMYVKDRSTSYTYLVILANEGDSIKTGDNTSGQGCPVFGTSTTTIRTDYGIFTVAVAAKASYISDSGFALVDSVNADEESFTVISGTVPPGYYPSVITALYYIYGDGNPNNQFEYGNIKDLSYSTSIVGSGNGTGNSNIDTISWYPFSDSNNKMFGNEGKVELRVVPGDYISGTQEGLLTQTYSDFVLDYAHAGHLATVQAYKGSYQVSWGVVMQKLSMTWPALQLIWDGDYWKKVGWVYQARYHSEQDENEDSWSEWQTVYTITSSTPTGTNGLDPSDGTALPGYYNEVENSFNTTSIVNNNTNNTYYINNVPTIVNVTPENENPSSGDSFWDWIGTILSSLLDLVGTIGGWISDLIGAVLGLAGDIINGILGLFQLPDFTINNYNTEVQTIKQNSGIFGQAVDFTTDVKTQLDTISTSPQDLVFTFPGISIMNTQIIPQVNGSYTQIVSDLGLSEFHNLVYLCTDGFVIISLIVLVYKKLMEVLKK